VFELGTPLWQVIVRTLAVYAAVLVGLRVLGKRQLGQMTIFDLVMILLIANAVQNAMVGPDTSLEGGIVAAVVLLLVNFGLSRGFARSRYVERLVESPPTLLVKDGSFIQSNLRHEGLAREEVEMAIREHGLESVRAVHFAYLEPDGTVSVVPMSTGVLRGHRKVRQMKKR